ncbi:glycosyltransferase family 4 protein [Patescibacteria group bacterium]|nr:glycosyltransferase family 4 protein [Patescibacteria group bacterium]
MKKILLVDPADFLGGAELFCTEIANELAKRHFEVHLATNGLPSYIEKLDPKIRIHKVKMKRLKTISPFTFLRLFSAFYSLQKIIRQEKIDIIQSNSIRSHIVATLASKATKTPCLWFVHDFTFNKKFANLLSPAPEYIFHSSEVVKADLKAKIPQKQWHKLKKIPNGINIAEIQNNTTKDLHLHKKYNIPKYHQLIGLVGRIDWWKGQKEFIKAAETVLKNNNSCSFLIIGDSSSHDPKTEQYKQEIQNLAKSLGIEKNIIFTGHVENVHSHIKSLDILVHASITPEPFGRVILEGMALKTPVIASNLGGPAEIIEHEKDGLLWQSPDFNDLAKKISLLTENSGLKHQLIAGGFEKIKEKYTLDYVVDSLCEVYENIHPCA